MSKRRKGVTNIFFGDSQRHFQLRNDLASSKAWQDLSSNAIRLYLEMALKFNGKNKDDISLTRAEGLNLMHTKTLTKAMDELIEHGFIYIVTYGVFTRKPNIYGFSDQWKFWPDLKPLARQTKGLKIKRGEEGQGAQTF